MAERYIFLTAQASLSHHSIILPPYHVALMHAQPMVAIHGAGTERDESHTFAVPTNTYNLSRLVEEMKQKGMLPTNAVNRFPTDLG